MLDVIDAGKAQKGHRRFVNVRTYYAEFTDETDGTTFISSFTVILIVKIKS